VSPLTATARFFRDAATAVELTPLLRSLWIQRLCAEWAQRWQVPARAVRARLTRRVRVGSGGRMLRATVRSGPRREAVWLKWCPDADPAALDATVANMHWWRVRCPELARRAADILDYWPDDRVLVIEERLGMPLGARPTRSREVVAELAGWMSAYAACCDIEAQADQPRLGSAVRISREGRAVVDARRLLEARAKRANESVEALRGLGFSVAAGWRERLGVAGLLADYHAPPRAGFVHGDFKPGNVLVTQDDFSIIDWWIAPCVSWPLTDVATFAGNLWLMDSLASRRIWGEFSANYFPTGTDELTARTLACVATCMCLDHLARSSRRLSGRLLDGRRCANALERLFDPRRSIAAFLHSAQQSSLNVETICA
jgi:hypothetical protein